MREGLSDTTQPSYTPDETVGPDDARERVIRPSEAALRQLATLTPDITTSSLVVYPGSATDEQCAHVFGDAVIHIDPDGGAMNTMHTKGFVTVTSTFEKWLETLPDGASIDLVFSYNAGCLTPDQLARVRPGGYVIANNWHGSANEMGKQPDFEVIAAINPAEGKLLPAETAIKGLGYTQLAITQGGGMVTGADIASLKPGSYTLLKQEKNTEALWLFQRRLEP